MDLDIRHLRLVDTIARATSITKAATVLGVSQPALTLQLQRVERLVGGPLFHRERHGVRPTALGEMVLTHGRAVLVTVDGLARSVRQHDQGGRLPSKEIRIGAAPAR